MNLNFASVSLANGVFLPDVREPLIINQLKSIMINNQRIKTSGRYALTAWLLALLLCVQGMVASDCLAQSQTATGNVVSKTDGLPLPGVNVVVKGTTIGTITDFDGNFSLQTENGKTLVFSFLGFKNQEVVYSGAPIKISLEEEASDLDEVVVVGYGVQKKKLVTGATVQVKGDDVQKLNTNNALQALQGQTPGVNIQSTSGQPGSSMNVSIRGLGTVGNSQPLYLIDGIGGDITTLNPADIESIDVLKDAASAAIYGAQAANGVVLVTTKSGKEGKGVVAYDGYYGLQRIYRKNEVLNAREYMTIMDEAALNSGNSTYDWASYSDVINPDGTPINDTDWLDQIIDNNAVTQSHNLSITGGSKTTNYALSIGYMGQEGIIGGSQVSNYDRYNFRINTESKLYDGFLTVGEHVGVVYKEQRGMGTGNIYNNNIRGAYVTSPLSPVYEEGSDNYYSAANQTWNNGDGNPLAVMMLNRYNRTKNMSVDANVYAQIEPIKNLKIKTVYGISYGGSEYRSYTPVYTSKDGVHGFSATDQSTYAESKVRQSQGNGISQVWQNTASYDFKIADEHQMNVLIGTEMSKYDGGSTGGYNTGLIAGFDDWTHAYLDNTEGTQSKSVSGSPYDSTRGASYFARVGWNWNEKYMVNATFRADASSKFEKSNRYGFFPSVSAGWTFSEENFMEGLRNVVDFAKLRASWGQVGNANINCYQYLAPVSTSNIDYNFGTGGGQEAWNTGSYVERLANSDVKWETSEQINVGLDLRLLESRLGVTFDWYKKTTKDWLVQAPVLSTAGTGGPIINGGDVTNTGVELAINWNTQLSNGIKYSIGANMAYNKNEVGEIPTEDGIIHGQTNQIFDNAPEFYRAENGHAIGYFWGLKTDGIFQNQQEINDWIAAGNGIAQSSVAPGDVKFIDVNHDGLIDESDRVDLGNGIPSWTYGVNLSISWKGWDLSAVGSGAADFQIVQSYRSPNSSKGNYTKRILDRWTGEGTSNKIPRVLSGDNGNWSNFSDLYIQDGDYFRIQNVTLGYDFKTLIPWKYLSQCRLYVQVQNLATFTKYDGMDPEIGSYNGNDGNSSDAWVSGVDMGYYPHPRTYLVGLNLKF